MGASAFAEAAAAAARHWAFVRVETAVHWVGGKVDAKVHQREAVQSYELA